MIVLHELDIGANRLIEAYTIVTLVEKTAVITEHFRFDDFDFRDGGVDYVHVRSFGSRRPCWIPAFAGMTGRSVGMTVYILEYAFIEDLHQVLAVSAFH